MATSTQLAQAHALMKENKNLTVRDAVLQVAKPPEVINAPVAGVAPAIAPNPAPVAPLSTNQQVLADNKAKVAGEIQAGTRPEVGQQMVTEQDINKKLGGFIQDNGINSVQPLTQTPTTPTPVQTPTPEAKAETPAIIKPTTPVVIPPTDKKGILNALTTGQPVTPTNTPEYRKATAVHTAFQKFNGMSEQQLLDNIKQGQITTEMGGLLAQNPSYQLARKKADELASSEATNNTIQGIKNGMTGKAMTTPNYLEAISDELIKKFGLTDQSSQEAFKTIVSEDPEVVTYTRQLHDINRQVAETTDMLNKGYAEMKANYGDLTQSQIMNYMSSSFKGANDLLSTLNNTKSYLEADLKNATDMAVAEYGAKQQDIEQMNAMKNQVFGQAVQSQFAIAQKLQEQGLADELAVQAQNDPTKAIPALIEQYTKLGVPMQRSVQEMIQEAQNEIANGGTLASYLTNLQKTIQSKPEYKRIQEMQQGQMTDMEKLKATQGFELGKMGIEQDFKMALAKAKQTTSGKWTKLDDGLYTNENGDIMTADEMKNAKLLGNSYITKDIGEEGGECGFYASRATGMSSTPGGNSKEARTKAFSETTPQVGGMAFFGGAGYDPTYGHISIVTSVNQDGTINVKDSNYNGDKRVTERTVPASSVTGFYNNTPLTKGVNGTPTETPVSSEANSWVNAWNNGTMDIETILTKIGSTKEALPLKNEVIQAIDKQGGVAWRKDTDPMVAKVQSIIDTISKSKNSDYVNTIAGNVQTSLSNFWTQGKSDLLADLKTIVEGNTLQALIDAKAQGATFGALSNEELKMLQATSSSLGANAIRDPDTKEIIGFKMSEEKLKAELEKMRNLFIEKKKRMTGDGIKSTTAPTAPVVGDSQGIR